MAAADIKTAALTVEVLLSSLPIRTHDVPAPIKALIPVIVKMTRRKEKADIDIADRYRIILGALNKIS